MTGAPRPDMTLLLERARAGDELARGELIAQVYDELRRVAVGLMRREHPGHTLPPTAVVHEAVIRLLGDAAFDRAAARSYLFAAAARHARGPHRLRPPAGYGPGRGGRRRVPLDAVVDYFAEQGLDLVTVHEALDRPAGLHERKSQVVTLRYFGGMTVPEIAEALEVSVGTVERDWRIARAWLSNQLREEGVG
jgi:RNA polymerase sigma factor (TIGR02999 family)